MESGLQLDVGGASVIPGRPLELFARLTNDSSRPQTFALALSGPLARWARVEPDIVVVPPGEQRALRTVVEVPRGADPVAGPTTLVIEAVAAGDPGRVEAGSWDLDVVGDDRLTLTWVPEAVTTRRRTRLDVVARNIGDQPVSGVVEVEASAGLTATVAEAEFTLGPGELHRSAVTVRAVGALVIGRPVVHTVAARRRHAGGSPPPTALVVQTPWVARDATSLVGRVVAIAAIGLASWFALVRPVVIAQARHSAGNVAPTAATNTDTAPAWDGQWALSAPAGATDGAKAVTVALGRRLELTDISWSNAGLDAGTLIVRRGTEVVLQWSLGANRNWTQALRSPLVVDAGQRLSVELDCQTPGDSTAAGCTASITLDGTLAPTA
jgi:hypothetical protein